MYYSSKDTKFGIKINKMIDLLFPMSTYCIICGNYVDSSRKYSICDSCISKIGWGKFEIDLDKEAKEEERDKVLDSSISCMNYGILEREIGSSLKYRKETYIARIIAEIMFDRIMNDENASLDFLNGDYIIPIPISEKRLNERGFNQTEKVAKYLSKKIDIPVLTDELIRVKDTKPLKDLSKMERMENMKGAFSLKKDIVKDKSIILLDDFYTTGITSYEAGKVLREKGAKEIHMISLATKNKYKKSIDI